jgi:hypothetical protein
MEMVIQDIELMKARERIQLLEEANRRQNEELALVNRAHAGELAAKIEPWEGREALLDKTAKANAKPGRTARRSAS